MQDPERPIPWQEVSREVLVRWVELEKMLEDYSKSKDNECRESRGMLPELLHLLAEQFDEEQTNLLHKEIAEYLRTLYRVNQVIFVLDRLCYATRWERDNKKESNIPLNEVFPMRLVYNPAVGGPEEIELVAGIHNFSPGMKSQTEEAVVQGRRDGIIDLFELLQADIPLMWHRRDLLPARLQPERSEDGYLTFLPTRVKEVYLGLLYKGDSNLPVAFLQIRPLPQAP
ncbi:MAG: hypothetical protein AAB414_00905 [Patescibacteria group bacterium]